MLKPLIIAVTVLAFNIAWADDVNVRIHKLEQMKTVVKVTLHSSHRVELKCEAIGHDGEQISESTPTTALRYTTIYLPAKLGLTKTVRGWGTGRKPPLPAGQINF